MTEAITQVLLVEDDAAQIDLIRHVFETAETEIDLRVAQNLHEARAQLQESTPDIVLADYELPDGNSGELLAGDIGTLPYPVVIISGHGDEQVAATVMKAGASDYIAKSLVPFTALPQIVERVQREWQAAMANRRHNELSYDQFKELSDNFPIMINAFDEQGRLVFWNRESERVTGYSATEIFNCDDVLALFYPDPEYRRIMLQEYQAKQGDFHNWVCRLTCKDGSERFISWNNISAKVPIAGWSSWATGRDITEQIQSRAVLEESRQKLQTVMDHMMDGLITIDDKGIVQSFNSATERMFGYTAAEVIGENVSMLMPEPHASEHNAYMERYHKSGEARIIGHDREVEGRRKDGSLFPLILGLAEISLQGKRHYVGTITDISTRKQVEQEQQLAATAFESHDAIMIADSDANILRVNGAFTGITGYSEDEVIGQNPSMLQSGRQDADFYERMWQDIKSNGKWHGEIWNQRKNGEIYPESLSITAVMDDAGKTSHYVAHFQDISARKQAEEKLELFKFAVEHSIDAVYWLLPDASIVYANKMTCQQLEYSREDILSMTVMDIAADVTIDSWQKQWNVIKQSGSRLFEANHRSKSGRVFPVEIYANYLNYKGKEFICANVSDITERKQTEQELAITNKELMSAHRQAGMAEVASGVLHNVGNILNSINVSASLVVDKLTHSRLTGLGKVVQLLDEHASDVGRFLSEDDRGRRLPAYLGSLAEHFDAEQQSMLNEFKSIRNNIEHIKNIVNRQQAYATSAGVTEIVLMDELLNDVLAMSVSEHHAIDVAIDVEDLPPVNVDKAKLLQILVNLVRNARQSLDACDHGDKRLTLQLRGGDDGRVRVSVIDNGVGIASGDKEKIFQYGHTTKKDGHGFGLHASALAAKEMGGLLSFHSDGAGCGAIFTLELPMEMEEIAA